MLLMGARSKNHWSSRVRAAVEKSARYSPARSPVEENGPGLLMSMHGRQMPVPPEWLGELGQGRGAGGGQSAVKRGPLNPQSTHIGSMPPWVAHPPSSLCLSLAWIILPRSSPASARFRDLFPSYRGVSPAPQSQASAV